MASPALPALGLRVVARDILADQVVGLTLAHPEGLALPAWTAGAHIDVVLDEGMVRQYSLCGDASDTRRYRIAVLRQDATNGGRGGSCQVHALPLGTNLKINGPRNHFALQPSPRYLFIAGGIGVTPILPMLAAASANGAPWRCLYGGRSRASMAFTDLLGRYGDAVRFWPQDVAGLPDLDALLCEPRSDTQIYCCGPEPLLQAVAASCARHGWPADALHVERFAVAPPPQDRLGPPDEAFDVLLSRSGKLVRVEASESLLDALGEAGIALPSSCGVGVCGTCETTVLSGTPDHRDAILSAEERASGKTMMICVSRARSPCLTLEL